MWRETPFACASFSSGGEELSYLDSGGSGPHLHFFHANGFPVSVYLPLLEDLARDFRVTALNLRGQDGLARPMRDWHEPAADLAAFLRERGGTPVIGVGHSLGGVATMFCAADNPDLFSGLALLDPAILSRRILALIRIAALAGRQGVSPLARKARRRRNGWKSRQEALDSFRRKPLFAGWEERWLRSYVTYGLKPAPGGERAGVVLVCPPEAEARAFDNYSLDVWKWPPLVRPPALFIRGEHSDVLSARSLNRLGRLCPNAQTRTLPGAGHLFPMQKPAQTLELVRELAASLRGGGD
jgi:pimeloyl-ACP methyl ester carboxylesterase